MSCTACKGRKTSRIVPVVPATRKPDATKSNPSSAKAQGTTLRDRLRYTGR